MTDRERLIELFEQMDINPEITCPKPNDVESCKTCKYAISEWLCDMRARKADYLLQNGVIAPPCKVGDVVYLIPMYNGKPYCGVCEDKVQMIGITSRGVHIKARNHHDHNKMYMLGKSIFLTKEEAEQALKEREGK